MFAKRQITSCYSVIWIILRTPAFDKFSVITFGRRGYTYISYCGSKQVRQRKFLCIINGNVIELCYLL